MFTYTPLSDINDTIVDYKTLQKLIYVNVCEEQEKPKISVDEREQVIQDISKPVKGKVYARETKREIRTSGRGYCHVIAE